MIDRTFMQAKALFKRPSFEEESRKKWASFWCSEVGLDVKSGVNERHTEIPRLAIHWHGIAMKTEKE